jgi:hypothetical protein
MTRSKLSRAFRNARRKRVSQVGAPHSSSTRSLSRLTRIRNARSLFSGTASPSASGSDTLYTARPVRVTVNGSTALPCPRASSATSVSDTISPSWRRLTVSGDAPCRVDRTDTSTCAS